MKLSFGTLPPTDATAGTPGETTVSIYDRTQGQDLPTPPTVHFENAAYSVNEGSSVAVKVKLSKAPGGEAVIPISRSNRAGATDADYSGAPDTLTFGATDTEKTITFAATDDTVDDDGEKVELAFGSLPGGITATTGEAAEAVVTITDDDDATARAIVLSPTSLTVIEEDETGAGYTVKLASQPSGAVTVTIGGLSGTDLILSGTTLNADREHTLSFTTTNWNTAQTVTVKSNHDADPFEDNATLLHQASDGGYDSASKALAVTVTDDDTAAVVLTPASITVAEGDATGVEYTVRLSHAPSGTVKVTVSGHTGTALSVSGTTLNASDELTFTVSDWNTAQTVTVTADQDDNAAGESLTLTHTPSGGGYSTAADLTVTVTDDDTAGIVLSKTALSVTEGDDAGVSYTVTLATQPSDTVTVTVGGHAGTALSVTGTTVNASDELTFTVSDWNTAQTVKVKAGEDGNDDDESETLTHSASGADYSNVTKDLPVTVEDDAPDTVTVTFGAASYTVTEGSSQTITVSLDEDPERTLTIPIEVANEGGASDSDYTGVPESVTFDAGDTSKSFDISATEDNLAESGEKVKLSFGTLPSDATAGTPSEATVSVHDRTQGQGLPTPPTVHFESATYSVTEGASVAVKVKLSKAPGGEAVIPISRSNRAGATDADYSGAPDTLTFGATDTEKTITFAATDDTVDDDGEKVELAFGSLPGGITATTGEAAEAVVTITDNDDATARAIVLSPTSLTVIEEDETGAGYTVKLASQPSGAVTVTIGGLSGTDLILSGTTLNADREHTLSFTTTNWNTAQTVTVKSNHDADPFEDNATLLHQASDGGYDSASKALAVTVTDDDTAAVVLTPASITVAEGDATGVEYTVRLSHAPSGTVKVTVSGHTGTALSVSGTTLNASDELTFTVSDWNTAQTVTVTADQDDNAAGESLTLTHTPSGGGYSTAADLTVTVTDDDTAGIVLSKTALSVTEGDDAGVSYTVTLATQPSDTVTVTVGGHAGTALSVTGTTVNASDELTFTVSDWNTAQTVKVKAGEDGNDDDESETLTHSASGADYSNVTKDLPVTVEDDAPDTVTVTFGAASYTVTEGSSQTITVSLDEDPERTLTIPIEVANEGGASDSDYTGVPESVTFDAGDTSKSFDVSAVEDNLAESGEKVKLSFGTLPSDATAGTPSEATVSVHDRTQGQGLPTPPTVHFESATYSVTEGASVAVKVKLSKAPGGEAVIPISRSNRAGATDADYSGAPDTLTFGATDTEKTITFAATDDTVDDDGEKVELAFGSLPGGITATTGEAAEAVVTITDNDDATARAIVLSPTSLTVIEEDETGAGYTVKLASQPSGAVTVTIGGLSGTDLILSGTTLNADREHTLSFTTTNWNTAQTVTVKSNHDADPFEDNATLLHQASDGGYDSASKALAVTVTDDDTAAVVLTPASITVAEGDATGVEYTVRLSHAPSGTVKVTVSGHTGTALSVSGTTLNASDELTFTVSDWNTAQTVTVTADQDDNAAGESLTLTHTPSGGGYSTAADLTVTVTDDDTAGIVLSKTALSVTEGDDAGVSYTVTLATQPSDTVTVTVGGHAGTALSVTGTTVNASDELTFTVSDWNTAQTVKVKAGEDGNDDDESETLTHSASGADYSNVTKDLPVTVEDDAPDTVTVSFGAASYSVTEGFITDRHRHPRRRPRAHSHHPDRGRQRGRRIRLRLHRGARERHLRRRRHLQVLRHIRHRGQPRGVWARRFKLSFGTLPTDASPGVPERGRPSPLTTGPQGQDLPTSLRVSTSRAPPTRWTEGRNSVVVKVKLSKAPGSETVIPITEDQPGRGVNGRRLQLGSPGSLTFAATDTEKTITFTATDDLVDDDDEKVVLSFGSLPGGITATTGEAAEAVVTITDDDDATAKAIVLSPASITVDRGERHRDPLHRQAGIAALRRRNGDHRRPQRHGPDPLGHDAERRPRAHPFLHDDELEHGADGDGEVQPRRGPLRGQCDPVAPGLGRRLPVTS